MVGFRTSEWWCNPPNGVKMQVEPGDLTRTRGFDANFTFESTPDLRQGLFGYL